MSRLEKVRHIQLEAFVVPTLKEQGLDGDRLLLEWKWLVLQAMKAEEYKKQIIEFRGKLHLSCPNCYEECHGWIAERKPCGINW